MTSVDACDYCRTEFGPSSERECRVCGAPRSSWESFVHGSNPYPSEYEGTCSAFSGEVVVRSGCSQVIHVTFVSPTVLRDVSCDDPSGIVRVTGVRVGTEELVASGSFRMAEGRAVLKRRLAERIVYPWSSTNISVVNPTSGDIVVSFGLFGDEIPILREDRLLRMTPYGELRPPPSPRTRIG